MKWLTGVWVAVLMGSVALAVMQTTQGTYEDATYMAQLTQAQAPLVGVHGAHGLASESLWWQIQRGVTPRQIRAVNLACAAFVSLAVGVLAWGLGFTAWVAAAVSFLHPLTVETLASMSGRAELFATLGVVSACAWAVRGTWWSACMSVCCLALGLLSKETAYVGLALIPLVCLWRDRRALVLVNVLAMIWLVVGVAWTERRLMQPPNTAMSALAWFHVQSAATVRLMSLAILPIGQTLDFDYDNVSIWWMRGAILGLGVLVVIAIWAWRQRQMWSVGLAWMLVAVLPRLILRTPKSYLNEHQFYLPLVGFALLVSAVYTEAPWKRS